MFKIGFCCLSVLSLSALVADHPQSQPQQNPDKPVCQRFLGHCPSFPVGGDVALSIDYFRSLPDGSWAGNFGAFSSVNVAVGIPKASYGFGAQVGGSYGLYDWDGRGSNVLGNTKAVQQQGFVTLGLFRMTPACSGINAGVVYDFMFNKQFGVFGVNPYITQARAQLAYLFQGGNELGCWATVNTHTSHRQSNQISLKFRAIPQVNVFWGHYFKNKAQTMLWAGTLYRRGLMYSSGMAGRYIVGGSFKVPLTTALSIIGHGVYMRSNTNDVTFESRNYAANVCFGLNYSFGGCKAGERPYLPLADNSNFLVDTNQNL